MTQRVTKLEAAAILDVSASTIDRMIKRGELGTETEPHGSRHKVWVLMDHDVQRVIRQVMVHLNGQMNPRWRS